MKKIDIMNELEKQKEHCEIIDFKINTTFILDSGYKFSIILKDNIKYNRSLFSTDMIEFYNKYILFYINYYEHELNVKVYYNQIYKIDISKIKVLNSKEIEENIK